MRGGSEPRKYVNGRRSGMSLTVVLLSAFLIAPGTALADQTIFAEDWESGWGDWWADNGIWQVGTPCPCDPVSGTNVAGTVLCGDYPGDTSSRLISPTIQLPEVRGHEEIWLRFWQWFAWGTNDWGDVQVRWRLEGGGWSAWTTISRRMYDSSWWSLRGVDLTDFAGEAVRIAFVVHSDTFWVGPGWFIDDVTITHGTPWFPMDPDADGFESGWAGWHADGGVWQVGVPTYGPLAAHGGASCAGTHIGGEYPILTYSRLISPTIYLPDLGAGEEIWLRFWQWFSWGTNGRGDVQVSERLPDGTWSGWQTLIWRIEYSSWWSRGGVELTAFAGKAVRVAFAHEGGSHWIGAGWYIDDVRLWHGTPRNAAIEGFEAGWGDWHADRGLWQVGTPTYGPSECYSGASCIGTHLAGDYPGETDTYLLMPTLRLPQICPGAWDEIWLRWWQWFSYAASSSGRVEISVQQPDGSWSAWTWLAVLPQNSGGVWTRASQELTA